MATTPPDSPGEHSCDSLRGRLRALNCKVKHEVEGGASVNFTKAQMQVVITKMLNHENSITDNPSTSEIPSRLVHMFWADLDPANWDNVCSSGSENQPGLKAALLHGCEVWLWTYHPGV